MKSLKQRLISKITFEPNSGCWIWLGADDGRDGYGIIRIDGHNRFAHRISYECFREKIPEGLCIDHLCRVRCCINPDHLEPVTIAENIRRGETGQTRQKHCKRGHDLDKTEIVRSNGSRTCRVCCNARQRENYQKKGRRTQENHPMAKLTSEDVRSIRRAWKRGATTNQISTDFGISRGYAWKISTGKTWKKIIETKEAV